jgi:hypothetical protein
MKGDMSSFFGQKDFLTLDGSAYNSDDEMMHAFRLVREMCPNDYREIAQMIGLTK